MFCWEQISCSLPFSVQAVFDYSITRPLLLTYCMETIVRCSWQLAWTVFLVFIMFCREQIPSDVGLSLLLNDNDVEVILVMCLLFSAPKTVSWAEMMSRNTAQAHAASVIGGGGGPGPGQPKQPTSTTEHKPDILGGSPTDGTFGQPQSQRVFR